MIKFRITKILKNKLIFKKIRKSFLNKKNEQKPVKIIKKKR